MQDVMQMNFGEYEKVSKIATEQIIDFMKRKKRSQIME